MFAVHQAKVVMLSDGTPYELKMESIEGISDEYLGGYKFGY